MIKAVENCYFIIIDIDIGFSLFKAEEICEGESTQSCEARFSPSRSPFPGTQLLCVVLHSPQNNQPIILTKNHIPATIQYITLSLSKANTPPLPLR